MSNEKKIAIYAVSEKAVKLAEIIKTEFPKAEIFSGDTSVMVERFAEFDIWLFIGAMGICVRSIAPCLKSKYSDPAVICLDTCANYAVAVVSGHIGGANEWCKRFAGVVGAVPVITTQSDNSDLWALDTLASRFGWRYKCIGCSMNSAIFSLVNGKKIALVLDVRDTGTDFLERTLPKNVSVLGSLSEVTEEFELIIYVGYKSGKALALSVPVLAYYTPMLMVGFGCRKDCPTDGCWEAFVESLNRAGISELAIESLSTIELKRDEPLLAQFAARIGCDVRIFSADDLKSISVPNPSEKVMQVTGVAGVSEASALASAQQTTLLVEKQKVHISDGCDFTYAVALNRAKERKGFIEIVGAGPGDPELISLKGKYFLERADLILYAGSLVPVELTYYAKPGAVVRSSASMALEEQFELMKSFYDRGLFVVRLHTGDPCIYGAIQEQMAFFDKYGMDYHITPGISSFLAAAAALQSQFTIPEKVQSIILTRGEGRTPMPDREKLHLLARSQSTMCIFLSASIVDNVQKELLECYPPETPVAACYHLTWRDEKIFRGELKNLAQIVKENGLTLTTMLVVGEAIDNRKGLSKLYSSHFKHLFRG